MHGEEESGVEEGGELDTVFAAGSEEGGEESRGGEGVG